jgi:ATP-dependent Lon protease
MGRQKRPRQKKKAYLHAGLDDLNELRVESLYTESPEKTMATLLRTAEKWVSLTTSKAHCVSHSLKARGGLPTAAAAAEALPAGSGRFFSFLESLPTEAPQDEDVLRVMTRDEKEYYFAQNSEARAALAAALRDARRVDGESVPLRFRVVRSRLPKEFKRRIILKLDRQNDSLTSGDSVKYSTWVELVLAIPIGEVLVPQPNVPLASSMARAKRHLEATIYGHAEAKAAILERFYLWLVSPFAVQRPLAICGVPGNGKTTLIREGLAAIMARPFAFVTLGGSADSSSLLGHGYTYEGSTPGRIVEHLVSSRCVNPIFYFDELDKCSATPKGDEIINALIHFTDPQQSDRFRDRYVGNLDIDLSRALSVFSFNDATAISPVLLDRLQVVHTDTFDCAAQAKIAQTHLVPQVLKERGLGEGKISFDPEALCRVARDCAEGGVRALRSVIEQAATKVALWTDAQDADMLAPLCEEDVTRDESGQCVITGGLQRLLVDKTKRRAPPCGMYM